MYLRRVKIKNFRSIFDMGDESTEVDLADGLNLFIGKNNCGKSNVLRAVAMAMDPNYPFSARLDSPAQRPKAQPTVTLEFAVDGKGSREETLLKYADEYELSIRKPRKGTLASDGTVILQVQYQGSFDEMRRTERINTRAGSLQGPAELRERVLRQLYSACHFVMLESGQSIESMLEGRFREILNSVIRDHLKQALAQAHEHREEYVRKLQDELLAPLRGQVQDQLTSVFPEMTSTDLMPQVPEVEAALAEVSVQLTDSVSGPLVNKGTGVRGGVLLAMLRYLASQSKRSMIFAVEEPEAFLHPEAQRTLAGDFVGLGLQSNVTLLATSHSPFMVPKNEHINVVSLEKNQSGATLVRATGRGSGPAAELLAPLFGDVASAQIFERTTTFDASVRGILLVEGYTDQLFIEAVTAQRTDGLLEGVIVEPVNGTSNLLARYAQLKATTDRPVFVLLDGDPDGRKGKKALGDHMKAQTKTDVATLVDLEPRLDGTQDWEAEDLLPFRLVRSAIDAHGGESILAGTSRRGGDEWHYDIVTSAKADVARWIVEHAAKGDLDQWAAILEKVDEAIQGQADRLRRAEQRRSAASSPDVRPGKGDSGPIGDPHPGNRRGDELESGRRSRSRGRPERRGPATGGFRPGSVGDRLSALLREHPGREWGISELAQFGGFNSNTLAAYLSAWSKPSLRPPAAPALERTAVGRYIVR